MISPLRLVVDSRRPLTTDVVEFTLVAPDASKLPAFDAGAHITVRTPSGAWRSYSLTNDDTELHRYVVAVKRERVGRGGSASMHDDSAAGDTIEVRLPRSSFTPSTTESALLVAGGIGITPMLAFLRRAVRTGLDAHLLYLTRDRPSTAYADLLDSPPFADHVTLHHTAGANAEPVDLWPYLANPDGRDLYVCGPVSLMNAVHLLTVHWPRSQVHTESFAGVDATGGTDQPFRLRRASTGELFDVPVGRSILDVLRDHGIAFDSSCESGTCGTCRMAVVDGEVHHRDLFLADDERVTWMMPCVSRSLGEEITVDF